MKAIKITLGLLLLIIILVVGAVFAVLANLNGIVKDAVETHGPEVTSTPVVLAGVDIGLLSGMTELTGFSVANPKGFSAAHAIKADVLRVKVDPMSITSGVIVIDDITVDGVNIVAEQKGLTTNLQELHNAIKRFTKAHGAGGGEETAEEEAGGSVSEPRFVLKNLRFANNAMQLITEKHGEYTLDIPTLERKNLGTEGQGLTAAELGVAIAKPLLDEAEESAKRRIKKLAKREVEDKLKEKLHEKVGEKGKKTIDKLKGLLGR